MGVSPKILVRCYRTLGDARGSSLLILGSQRTIIEMSPGIHEVQALKRFCVESSFEIYTLAHLALSKKFRRDL